MDSFDFSDAKVRPPINIQSLFFNLLTLMVLTMSCGAGLLVLLVFVNPQMSLNPFPPPPLPALVALPTSTPTPLISLPPTWTPTADLRPTSTMTAQPLVTGAPTDGTLEGAGSELEEGMPFVLQPGNPVAIANFSHPDLGCNWMGVAGQVIALDNVPIPGLMVQLGGVLDGNLMVPVTVTGTATQYGEGAYEFTLDSQPKASQKTLWVQLLDQDGNPLSEKIYFDTFEDCEKALVLVNFNQVK
jgi:hypothetical protein